MGGPDAPGGASLPRADMAHSLFHPSQEDILMAEASGVRQIFQQPQPPPASAAIQGGFSSPSPWAAVQRMPGQAAPMASPALLADSSGTAPLHLPHCPKGATIGLLLGNDTVSELPEVRFHAVTGLKPPPPPALRQRATGPPEDPPDDPG
eukprot:11405767-Heterocapsa_arctica.AAC.1